MTLSEVSTLLKAPEGMEWYGRETGLSFEYEARRTSSVWVNLRGDATQDDDARGWYVTVTACYVNISATTGAFLPDLPAAYARALAAVGLAPDPEKEALRREVEELRRRLTWTEEVPTEPGVYVVGRGVKPYDGSIMFRRWDEDGGKMERPWVDAFGLPWTDEQMKGRRFFALDNLKETP